jgi:hypothetical protein
MSFAVPLFHHSFKPHKKTTWHQNNDRVTATPFMPSIHFATLHAIIIETAHTPYSIWSCTVQSMQ